MARRMSNRDRIARMRDEAEVQGRERDKARAWAGQPPRMRAVWAVKDGAGTIVKVFPYARKDDAQAEAERLREGGRHTYIVVPHKVPFDG